jgi:hypothetical protein
MLRSIMVIIDKNDVFIGGKPFPAIILAVAVPQLKANTTSFRDNNNNLDDLKR